MTILIIRFLDLLMAGLIAGVIFGIWIGYNPQNFSAQTYVEQQQSAIKALNTLMPLLGLITILLTIVSAFLQRDNKNVFIALSIAAVFLIVSGLVTRFGNQPINSIIMTWNKVEVPGNWTELRDKWWSLHKIRTVTAVLAFCIIIWTNIKRA